MDSKAFYLKNFSTRKSMSTNVKNLSIKDLPSINATMT